MVIARSSRAGARFDELGEHLLKLDTFSIRPLPELVVNFRAARSALLAHLVRNGIGAVITLMPHVWTPLLAPAIKKLGILYLSVAHDAAPHPGDPTGILTPWLLRDTKHADMVITLSKAVADRLVASCRVPAARIACLFHPDLHYGSTLGVRRRSVGDPLRLLFFGRVLKYKGLPLLIDVVEKLRAEGLCVHLGVAGAGNLGSERRRLEALQAEVINRWIDDCEVGPLLARYDAVALSHVEASQSGVASAAFGSRMPVVAMPVGGLAEQVVDGRTGVLALRPSHEFLADAIRKLALDTALFNSISDSLAATAADRSMQRFVAELANLVVGCTLAMEPLPDMARRRASWLAAQRT
jgi:glycosyltransferase involved in cell wall biosynthesis